MQGLSDEFSNAISAPPVVDQTEKAIMILDILKSLLIAHGVGDGTCTVDYHLVRTGVQTYSINITIDKNKTRD